MSGRKKGGQVPNRLPGRLYTLTVTVLAVVLISIPLLTPQSRTWNTVAVVQHLPIRGATTAESIVLGRLEAAAAEISSVASTEISRTRLAVTTAVPTNGEERLTTIQLRHADRQSAELVSVLARDLAASVTQRDHTAAVISNESDAESRLDRASLFPLAGFALVFGATTILFPRPRQQAQTVTSSEQVEDAAGSPVLGSVFPSGESRKRKRSSNIPLRCTVFLAEFIVAVAFALTLYFVATDADFRSQLLGNPLDTYAQSMRTVGAEIQALARR